MGVMDAVNRLSSLVHVDRWCGHKGVDLKIGSGRQTGITCCIQALNLNGEVALAQGRDIGRLQIQLPTRAISAHSHWMAIARERGGLA